MHICYVILCINCNLEHRQTSEYSCGSHWNTCLITGYIVILSYNLNNVNLNIVN